jgi:SNF2 family DNA or RNA helicase
MQNDRIIADILVSDDLDRLVITPRNRSDRYALIQLLRQHHPRLSFRQYAEGIGIPSFDADQLLTELNFVDFRWTAEAKQAAKNRAKIKRVHGNLKTNVATLLKDGRSAAESFLRDAEGLDVLDDHQWVNVAAMTLPHGYGLDVFDEQGAGKTVTLIFALDVLIARDEVDFALIIAPKSMIPEWPRDILRFTGDRYKVAVVTGARQQKQATLTIGADIIVTNFETTVSMEAELRVILQRHQGRAILVVDESFYIKSLDAKRTRALRRLREWCGRAFVLCGTPAPNSPHDLIQQFNIVDFGFTFNGVDVPQDRDAARPVVQRAIDEKGCFVRHLKSRVLPDLPPKRFNRVLVPLQPQQRKLYEGALRNLILDLRSTDDEAFHKHLASFLAKRSALLQICSNPSSVAPQYDEVPAKLLALDEILDELILKRTEKVIIWSFYTAAVNSLMSRYSRFNPVRYDGSVTDVNDRREGVRRFQEDDDTMLFVANPAAAGAGLTLHRARFAIYESMSNQAAHYLQSLDRIHRRGQTRDVEYMVLLCDQTIEIQEYERLIVKEQSAQTLLGDAVQPPITRSTMMDEAIGAAKLLGLDG